MAQRFAITHAVIEKEVSDITLIVKWGCDGCGSLARFKQKSFEGIFDDSSVLVSSFVPLQLHAKNSEGGKKILWQNQRTSSTRFCKPIRFRFVKESEEELVNEMTHIRQQIQELKISDFELWGHKFAVKSEFLETMVDGKVCNALASNRATQKCYICRATNKDMNNLEEVQKRKCDEQTFSWGLSPLHAFIRCMECLLHIAYKLEIKKWRAGGQNEKDNVASGKKQIIDRCRSETGLLIDTPKQGAGGTNDGNTARRFFQNSMVSSDITGVDEELIERFNVILQVLASSFEIKHPAFEDYTLNTAKLYIRLYGWYPMPVTVHKILIHSPAIAKEFLIPIGQLSEDVQESRPKEFEKYRQEFSRKISRTYK